MAVPATVVYFTSYEQFKSFLGYRHDGPYNENWFKPVLAGSGARGMVYFIVGVGVYMTLHMTEIFAAIKLCNV